MIAYFSYAISHCANFTLKTLSGTEGTKLNYPRYFVTYSATIEGGIRMKMRQYSTSLL